MAKDKFACPGARNFIMFRCSFLVFLLWVYIFTLGDESVALSLEKMGTSTVSVGGVWSV